MNPDRNSLRRELRQRRREIPAGQRIAAAESLAAQLLALPCMPHLGLRCRLLGDGWRNRIACLPDALAAVAGVLPARARRRSPALCALAARRCAGHQPLRHSGTRRRRVSCCSMPRRWHWSCCRWSASMRMGSGWAWAVAGTIAASRSAIGHPAPPWLVGAAFAAQQVDAIAAEAWDVALDAVCTERETLLVETVSRHEPTQRTTG